MVTVIVGAAFLPSCFAALTNPSSIALNGLDPSAPGSCNDTDCCSSCFCCHCAAVLKAIDTIGSLAVNRFTDACLQPFVVQLSLAPSHRPPR